MGDVYDCIHYMFILALRHASMQIVCVCVRARACNLHFQHVSEITISGSLPPVTFYGLKSAVPRN